MRKTSVGGNLTIGDLNLDGGGSSTMWVNGRVVNSPSDKRERAVANTLVICRMRR